MFIDGRGTPDVIMSNIQFNEQHLFVWEIQRDSKRSTLHANEHRVSLLVIELNTNACQNCVFHFYLLCIRTHYFSYLRDFKSTFRDVWNNFFFGWLSVDSVSWVIVQIRNKASIIPVDSCTVHNRNYYIGTTYRTILGYFGHTCHMHCITTDLKQSAFSTCCLLHIINRLCWKWHEVVK